MNDWIFIISRSGGNWSEWDLYINPGEKTAKMMIRDQIGIDADGEPYYLEYEAEMTIEEALEEVNYSEELTAMVLKLLEDHK